ncbi:Anti-sigma F factor [subsurface metagenome]
MKKRLEITSLQKNIRLVEALIDEITSKQELKADIYGRILIGTVEAVNNAIIHGNKSNPEKVVNIRIYKTKKELHIIVKDEGEGFDYKNVPDPTAPENIENIHGRGFFLMTKLSDKIVFYENGSRVELIYKL